MGQKSAHSAPEPVPEMPRVGPTRPAYRVLSPGAGAPPSGPQARVRERGA
jgi:hypothetical protein